MRTTMLAILCLFGSIAPLEAATYYVRKTGNNANTGTTPAAAWLTIQKAATTLVAGDTVYVGAGTYTEAVAVSNDGTAANPIKFIADTTGAFTGDAGNVNVTTGASYTFEMENDQYIQLYGFRISGGTTTAADWHNAIGGVMQDCEIYSSNVGVRVDDAVVTLQSCTIRNHSSDGVSVTNGTGASSSTLIVKDCFIYSCSDGIHVETGGTTSLTCERTSIYSNSVRGIDQRGESSTVKNCLVRNNGTDGFYLSAGTNTLWHCTFANNGGDGLEQGAGTLNMRNCILAANSQYGLRYSSGTCAHTYNCVSGNGWGNFSGTGQSTGETTADPRFWSATCFELEDGSPCINTGVNPGGAVTEDIEQVARPSGGAYDMGCYETVTLTYGDLPAAYTALTPYAWWRLNETSGSTASDQMGVRNGTYQNGVVLNQMGGPFGSFNKAASFDGVNDKVNLSTINPTVSTMSFVGWIKADTFNVTNADYIAKASGTLDSNYYWSLGSVNSGGQQRVQFRFRAGGATAVAVASSGNMSTNTWVFVAGVFDGKAAIIYKDGIEVGRATLSGTPDLNGATNAAIGDNPVGGRPFDGLIDEVAIFTKALKPRQIAAIYASSLKGSVTAGVVPKLWGIDEDDAQLFAFTNYNNPGTVVNYGRLKWNNGGVNTDLSNDSNLSSLAIDRTGRAYITSDTSLGGSAAPVLLSFNLTNASTTLPNVVSIVGSISTSIEIRGLAFDPTNDDLYALRSDGWLFVISKANASIVRTVGQVTGMGDVVTTGEDLAFDPFGNLYVADDADDEFYRVNKANGAIIEATPGGSLGTVQSFAWDAVNNRILIGESGTDYIMHVSADMSSAGFLTGLAAMGFSDIEAIGFVPSEGRTGVWPAGVRVVRWKEVK